MIKATKMMILGGFCNQTTLVRPKCVATERFYWNSNGENSSLIIPIMLTIISEFYIFKSNCIYRQSSRERESNDWNNLFSISSVVLKDNYYNLAMVWYRMLSTAKLFFWAHQQRWYFNWSAPEYVIPRFPATFRLNE